MRLVRVLLGSLDNDEGADAERTWDEEIARRIAELDSGNAKTVSWEEVRQRVAARIYHCE